MLPAQVGDQGSIDRRDRFRRQRRIAEIAAHKIHHRRDLRVIEILSDRRHHAVDRLALDRDLAAHAEQHDPDRKVARQKKIGIAGQRWKIARQALGVGLVTGGALLIEYGAAVRRLRLRGRDQRRK